MEVPARPRLGSHVQARRHVVGEVAHVILHDGPRTLAIGDREWTVLRQADGTRDLEGICLAARRAGAPARVEHVRAFFGELAALGLLDEREAADEVPAFARDLPIVALPGYRFRCDGSGDCCSCFDTMLFTPLDVVRARAARPELGDERDFLPERGADSPLAAVSRRDGSCIYLDTQAGGCRVHAVKPTPCRTFPARYVDVGDAIRVAPRPECACVFSSASDPQGEPLTSAARGSELSRELFVPAIGERTQMGPDAVGREALVAFFDAARARVEAGDDDLALLAWTLAERVERDGARAALDAPLESPAGVRGHLGATAESADRIARTHLGWRSERDAVRVSVEATARALARLKSGVLPAARAPADERLYLRASLFTALGIEASVEAELRSRALALWIARAFDEHIVHPLASVEALARGHGLQLGASNPGTPRPMEAT